MIDKKVLNNIEPFNEIFYRTCFYNSFFPVIKHFNKDISPFFLNDINVYEYSTNGNVPVLSVEYIPYDSLTQLLKDNEINVITQTCCPNLIENITNAIAKGSPVIIYVDSYYESIRKDTYLKKHMKHSLLIYGFDKERQEFNIIEHNYSEQLSYEKKTISFKEIEQAYYAFTENFSKAKSFEGSTYFEFSLNNDRINYYSHTDCINKFKLNLYRQTEKIYEGLEFIKLFAKEFQLKVSNVDLLKSCIYTLSDSFTSIINEKKAEKYKMQLLLGEKDELIETLDFIIENYLYIRNQLFKYGYSSKYKYDLFVECSERILKIYELEKKYIEGMFERFKE